MPSTVVAVAELRPSEAALLEVFLATNSDAAAIISLRHAAENYNDGAAFFSARSS